MIDYTFPRNHQASSSSEASCVRFSRLKTDPSAKVWLKSHLQVAQLQPEAKAFWRLNANPSVIITSHPRNQD
jgi:hypothetical protein